MSIEAHQRHLGDRLLKMEKQQEKILDSLIGAVAIV